MCRDELFERPLLGTEDSMLSSEVVGDDHLAKSENKELEVFPFFRLPFELRILCYQYLVPNTVVPSYPVPSRFSSPEIPTEIRDDKQICTPGILGVSKQVHGEVIDLFYGSGRFELTVVKRGFMTFDFLGAGFFFDDDNLPPIYYLVRHLKLTIKIKGLLNDDLREQISRIYQHCFLHNRHSALESLHIEFEALQSFWNDHLRSLAENLKGYLEPLKEIQGLKAVTQLHDMGIVKDLSVGKRDEISAGIQNALSELKRWMVLPGPAAIVSDQENAMDQEPQTKQTIMNNSCVVVGGAVTDSPRITRKGLIFAMSFRSAIY